MSESTATPSEVKVAWSDEDEKEPGRDFIGTIVSSQYPFIAPDAKFEGEQLQLLVRAEEPPYEKLQPIWLPPSDKKETKFSTFRKALVTNCQQAWREIYPKVQQSGADPKVQIKAFGDALVGLRFHFVDKYYPRPGKKNETMKILTPISFAGRGQVSEVQTEKIQL